MTGSQRILLIKPSSLGDVIHALPVLHGLRVRYPEALIDWLVATPYASLLAGHPELNGLVRFERRRFARLGRSPRVTREFVGFVNQLRERRYDLVIDLQGLFRTGFLAWASGARVRIGFRASREFAWVFYTHYLPGDDPDSHAVDRNYLVGRILGFADVPVVFDLALPEAAHHDAARLLQSVGVRADARVMAVVPGARWETKRWPAERFARVIDALTGSGNVQCVLLGGPEEAELCRQVGAGCAAAPADLAGRTSLPQLAGVLARADVVLCHDSAAAHLAAALERPLVCLAGPTNPRRTGPYRRPRDVLQLPLDCAPCYLRRLSQCPHQHRCMQEIEPETVIAAMQAGARTALDYKVPQRG